MTETYFVDEDTMPDHTFVDMRLSKQVEEWAANSGIKAIPKEHACLHVDGSLTNLPTTIPCSFSITTKQAWYIPDPKQRMLFDLKWK